MKKVPVYADEQREELVGRVTYNARLDYWDGKNIGNGGTGMHKGISRLTKSGRMVIIIGSQWQGSNDYGYCVSDAEAVRECIEAKCPEIIEEYPQLIAAEQTLDSDN